MNYSSAFIICPHPTFDDDTPLFGCVSFVSRAYAIVVKKIGVL